MTDVPQPYRPLCIVHVPCGLQVSNNCTLYSRHIAASVDHDNNPYDGKLLTGPRFSACLVCGTQLYALCEQMIE